MKEKIESAIANVQTAFPSIFSKEDVLSILGGLHSDSDTEEETEVVHGSLTDDQIDDLIEKVKEAVMRKLSRLDTSDLVDTGTAEFEINYGNTIELTNVEVNVDDISDVVNEVIEDKIQEFFNELASEQVEETEG